VRRIDTELAGVCIIEPKVFGDHRGYFFENYNLRAFADIGITTTFVQDNHSGSSRGVLRGLHYQLHQPQAKLVRVIRGEVYDVAVDIRVGSPTFGRWTATMLSGENRRMLFIAAGFAHGFIVVSEEAEFIYKCSDFYAPEHERGIAWNDPAIGIDWPLGASPPVLSAKDRIYGPLSAQRGVDLPRFMPAGA
jgi:dTDP-4-dehydrorhamnose 3,5-epimerase